MDTAQYNAANAWNWNGSRYNNNTKSNTNNSGVALSELDRFAGDNYISIEELYDAYFACRKNKRGTINAIQFEVNYEENLYNLWYDINSGKYEIGRSICFIVRYPKKREVFAADFRDRVVHHLVVSKLEPLLEEDFITDSYNCRKGKGVLYGVRRLAEKIKIASNYYTRDAYVAKFDCKGFFMSIDKKMLSDMLDDYIEARYDKPDKDIVKELTRKIVLHRPERNCIRKSHPSEWKGLSCDKSLFTCKDNFGLPIGNLSSQIFANFYLMEFDHYMNNRFNWFYGRYVDDFYVIAERKKDITNAIDDIRRFLMKYKVELHPSKFYMQHYSKGIKFTGAVVKYDRIYMANRTKYNFSRAIGDINRRYDLGYAIHARQRLNSYIGFSRQYKNYNIRKKLLQDNLSSEWWHVMHAVNNFNKLVVNKKYLQC